jgi:hypothetical protein
MESAAIGFDDPGGPPKKALHPAGIIDEGEEEALGPDKLRGQGKGRAQGPADDDLPAQGRGDPSPGLEEDRHPAVFFGIGDSERGSPARLRGDDEGTQFVSLNRLPGRCLASML